MLILHLWRFVRASALSPAAAGSDPAARPAPARPGRQARSALAALDRRTLRDVGIGPGAIVSLAGDLGLERLRRPPHL